VRRIPNVPENAEAYYAPDSLHVIAQTKDAAAQSPETGNVGGSLTYTLLNVGPENFKGSIAPRAARPAGWVEDPALKEQFGDRLGS